MHPCELGAIFANIMFSGVRVFCGTRAKPETAGFFWFCGVATCAYLIHALHHDVSRSFVEGICVSFL